MGGGGGKGGESKQSIDPRLTDAAVKALDFAAAGAAVPYSPNRGVQFAAFTPQQEAAMANTSNAAAAFGLDAGNPNAMPTPETSAGGIRGYSTGADYDQMKDRSMTPGLQAAIAGLFADPETGMFTGPGGPLFGEGALANSRTGASGESASSRPAFKDNPGGRFEEGMWTAGGGK